MNTTTLKSDAISMASLANPVHLGHENSGNKNLVYRGFPYTRSTTVQPKSSPKGVRIYRGISYDNNSILPILAKPSGEHILKVYRGAKYY